MRHLRLLFTAMFAVCALTAFVATSVASAATEEGFLPAPLPTFTGTGGAGELLTLAKEKIACTATSVKAGTIETDQIGKVGNIHFTGCKALGFPANTLSDEKEVILVVNAPLTLCLINSATLEYGILVTLPETLHIEVPLGGVLIAVSGKIIGKISPNGLGKEKTITFAQSSGDATDTKCTGAKAGEKLVSDLKYENNENKKPENAGLASIAKLTFSNSTEIMDGTP